MLNNRVYFIFIKLLKKVFNRLKIFGNLRIFFNKYYHNYVYRLLSVYLFKAYKNTCAYEKKHRHINDNNSNPNIIWMFWWQGYEYAPLIVKKCIMSIYKNSSNYKVILITKYNINKYVTFSSCIKRGIDKHYITLTHLSDILRFKLLYQYGGLWIDSTIFCTSTIKCIFHNGIYTSGGYDNRYNVFVSAKWTGFLIGGEKYLPTFYFMNDFFHIYWKNNNKLIDYFLIDYGLKFIYDNNINGFRYYVDNIAKRNNPHLHDLQPIMNKRYNKNVFICITSDTNLFKLTYKKKIYPGIDSFYNRLVHNDF